MAEDTGDLICQAQEREREESIDHNGELSVTGGPPRSEIRGRPGDSLVLSGWPD